MIQANELRIGNWVKIHEHKGFSKIHTIGITTQCNYVRVFYIDDENNERISNGYCEEIVHAIPLTEEILLKCGFENDFTQQSWHHRTFIINDFEIEEIEKQYFYNRLTISSLHQLQNLYFALTNKELNITL